MIYFTESESEIKLGFTDDLMKRLRQHEGYGFNHIASLQGTEEDEDRLKKFFCHLRTRKREWFKKDDEIYEYIELLVEKGFAHTDATLSQDLPHLPYSAWGPQHVSRSAVESNGQMSIFAKMPVRERIALLSQQLQNNSITDEWYTPRYIIDLVREALGGAIDTDPATSTAVNMKFIQAKLFYTKFYNGLDLTHPWIGSVWINPPYGRHENSAGQFIARLADELTLGCSVKQAITCLNVASMSSKWFYSKIPAICAAHCIMNGRPNFSAPEGKTGSSPTKGIVITYYGRHRDRFISVFRDVGQIMLPWRSDEKTIAYV